MDRHFFILKPLDGLWFASALRVYRYRPAATTFVCRGRTNVILISCNFCRWAAYCLYERQSEWTAISREQQDGGAGS